MGKSAMPGVPGRFGTPHTLWLGAPRTCLFVCLFVVILRRAQAGCAMSHLQNRGSALPEGGQPKHLPRRMEGAQEPLSRRRHVRQWILAGGHKADPPETACKRPQVHLGHRYSLPSSLGPPRKASLFKPGSHS